jgi:hypothetical protein
MNNLYLCVGWVAAAGFLAPHIVGSTATAITERRIHCSKKLISFTWAGSGLPISDHKIQFKKNVSKISKFKLNICSDLNTGGMDKVG